MNRLFLRAFALVATATASTVASTHVTLPPGGATAGDPYAAAFRVGHACTGARSTTGITVRIPEGFSVQPGRGSAFCTLKPSGMRTLIPVVLRAPGQAWPTRKAAA